LTPGQAIDIAAAGDNFGELAYVKCKAAIERSKPVTKTEAAPKLSKSEAEKKAEADAKAKVIPSQDEVLAGIKSDNPRIDAVMHL